MAVVGNLSIDRVAGGAAADRRRPVPRGARAPAARGARRAARALRGRRPALPPAAPRRARHTAAHLLGRATTAAFSFAYDGGPAHDERRRDRRHVDSARRARCRPAACAGSRSRRSLRSDFPTETLAELGARDGACCSTARGSSAGRRRGPLELDADFDRELFASRDRSSSSPRRRRELVGDVDVPERIDHARLARRDRPRERPRDARRGAAARRATRRAPATRSPPRTSSRARPGTRPRRPHAARPRSWERRCDEGRRRRPSTARSRSTSRRRRSSRPAPSTFARLEPLDLSLPKVVAAAAAGSTVVAVVDRKPPLDRLARRRHHVARDGRRTAAGQRRRDRRGRPGPDRLRVAQPPPRLDERRRVLARARRRAARDRGGRARALSACGKAAARFCGTSPSTSGGGVSYLRSKPTRTRRDPP